MRALICVILLCTASYVGANTIPPAYIAAAERYDLKPDVLFGIAVAESYSPSHRVAWPWTANVAGKGMYFDSRDALYDYLSKQLASGRTNFDVGIMQVNWRWNSKLFNNHLWEATNPYVNVDVAARHLRRLLDKHGNYESAIKAYHVGTLNRPEAKHREVKYLNKVLSIAERASAQ